MGEFALLTFSLRGLSWVSQGPGRRILWRKVLVNLTFLRAVCVLMAHARPLLALVRDQPLLPLLAALPILANCASIPTM